jgi:hypothetical protein
MQERFTRAALPILACALLGTLLGACSPRPAELPATALEKGMPFPRTSATPMGDTSVPAAGSVYPGTPAATPASTPTLTQAAAGQRDNSGLTAAEESRSMPQAGQANDHSAPLPGPVASPSAMPAPLTTPQPAPQPASATVSGSPR